MRRVEEDKQKILDLLLPALRETRNLHDLDNLEYFPQNSLVYATFKNGYIKVVDVECDSGTAMIQDVIRGIV
ncbi:hypothetical protein FND36_02810 [Lachnospiraceae bacterium KGMB03038]|nr:hypothetical protein FND36_02810 [Lachnospiraceae bacterium KGMB03038]